MGKTSPFSEEFLKRYPAFRGALSPGDQATGEQWFAIWNAARESAADVLNPDPSVIRLMAGEMACQEMRTVQAVLAGLAAKIRRA